MSAALHFPIHADTALCSAVRGYGLDRFEALCEHIRALPYGRVSGDADILAVLVEALGTCSSKHRLLAAVAHECGHRDVRLTVGIYLMSGENTPGVAAVLQSAGIVEIPEAHCYLSVGTGRLDFTGLAFGAASPFESIVVEHDVAPKELPAFKASLHRSFMASWAESRGIDPRHAWTTREACIAVLSLSG